MSYEASDIAFALFADAYARAWAPRTGATPPVAPVAAPPHDMPSRVAPPPTAAEPDRFERHPGTPCDVGLA